MVHVRRALSTCSIVVGRSARWGKQPVHIYVGVPRTYLVRSMTLESTLAMHDAKPDQTCSSPQQ